MRYLEEKKDAHARPDNQHAAKNRDAKDAPQIPDDRKTATKLAAEYKVSERTIHNDAEFAMLDLLLPIGGELVHSERCPAAEAERFAGIVSDVWQALPADVCQDLAARWQPRVELLEQLPPGLERRGAWGAADVRGRRLVFDGPCLSWVSDRHVALVVAHELAHALLFVRGLPHNSESWTRQVAGEWGFPHERITWPDEACNCHYRSEQRVAETEATESTESTDKAVSL